jgi:hypothetical protein
MRHAAEHARTRTRETRQRLAREAARLMADGGIRDFHVAKLRAAAKLGVLDENALPRNAEIEEALREYQRLFRAEAQPQVLRALREAALEALRFFERFEPRLVGAVLDGSADQHSAVCLHLYTDEPESVAHFLAEHGIPVEQQSRRLRLDRERSVVFPVYVFSADGTPFDLTVLPRDALRQAPLDRIDDRPMKRGSLSTLRELLAHAEG